MSDHRPWKIVAPWYRWQRQVLEERKARSPRETCPVFQKFDRPDFVDGFLSDPQHSLKFNDSIDRIFTSQLIPSPVVGSGALAGKLLTLFAPKGAGGQRQPQAVKLLPTGIRKIFLDTHKRHYLVACELHCDAPGFPSASFEDVCEAGFVIRRRLLKYPSNASAEALAILKRIVAVQAQIAELDQTSVGTPARARRRAATVRRLMERGELGPQRTELASKLVTLRQELSAWRDDNAVESINEAWIPSSFDKIGSWQVTPETPEVVTESKYPLYKLYANPELPKHDAEGRAIFFGALPTSSLDTDERGRARFDSEHLYEIRCFVRRHKPECPRTENIPDCHGEVFWSQPTEAYRLAPQFDLVGTANRPVTIQMPDLRELAAQAATLPFGSFSPVRVVQPQALDPKTDGKACTGGAFGSGGAICFFAIPLITIVAFFVLQLFLPIVIFLFGLWFLLVFKFCIPPSLSIDAGLQLELETLGNLGLDVDADIDVSLGLGFDIEDVNIGLRDELVTSISGATGVAQNVLRSDLGVYANSALLAVHRAFDAQSKLPDTPDPDVPAGPDLFRGLEYELRVEEPMVVT